MIKKKDWSTVVRRAMSPTETISALARLEGWILSGEGVTLAIQKTFGFSNFYETMAFVNALAFLAHVADHHPELSVCYSRCIVRFNTHDVNGISSTDFESAAAVDALLE